MGFPVQKRLVAELMGRTCNLYLLSPEGRIIDCLRRIGLDESAKRAALPGLNDQEPEPITKIDPADAENYVNYHGVNDTGAVLRVHYPNRDVLFLADIEPAAARELMELYTPEQLQCDIVQLAHHGQSGAHREFYEIVLPKIALYTAPDWLWTNNNGSGPFKTLQTRQWMRELGVVLSCPHCHGDFLLV
jgi:hypothetical protein